MTEGLRSLTTRGRILLGGGLAAAVAGMLLAERDLVLLGLLAALLPPCAACWIARTGHRARLHRHLPATVIEAGQSARVTLSLTATGRPLQQVRLEEEVPWTMGLRPRFRLGSLDRSGSARASYEVGSAVRGGFQLGPARLHLGDPFGLVDLRRGFAATTTLIVTPGVRPLPGIALRGAWSSTGESRPRSFSSGNAADVTVREYRRGDDLRRVHWRSSAHAGDLMVRREEQPWQARCTVLLDNRVGVHSGSGPGSTLERAVETAASVAVHLLGRGLQVRVVTATGEQLGGGWTDGDSSARARPLLEALAVLDVTRQRRLTGDWVEEQGGAMLLAVLGAVDEPDRAAFDRIRRTGSTAYALCVEPGDGVPASAPGSAAALLAAMGWTAAPLRPGEPLARAWQELGR